MKRPPPPPTAREPLVIDPENHAFVAGTAARPTRIPGSQRRLIGLGVIAVLMLWPLYLFGTVVREWLAFQEIQRAGITTQAEIVSVEKGRGPAQYAIASYRYQAGGQERTRTQLITAPQLASLQPGMAASIRYLAIDPTMAYLPDSAPPNEPLLIYFCITLFFGLPLMRSIERVRQDLALMRQGRLMIGAVESCEQVPLRFRPIFDLRYSFALPSGTRQQGTYRLQPIDIINFTLPTRGDPVALVVIDRYRYHIL